VFSLKLSGFSSPVCSFVRGIFEYVAKGLSLNRNIAYIPDAGASQIW